MTGHVDACGLVRAALWLPVVLAVLLVMAVPIFVVLQFVLALVGARP